MRWCLAWQYCSCVETLRDEERAACPNPKRQVPQHLGRANATVLSLTMRTQLLRLVKDQLSCRKLECPSLRLYCPLLFSHSGAVPQILRRGPQSSAQASGSTKPSVNDARVAETNAGDACSVSTESACPPVIPKGLVRTADAAAAAACMITRGTMAGPDIARQNHGRRMGRMQ